MIIIVFNTDLLLSKEGYMLQLLKKEEELKESKKLEKGIQWNL